jgi:hypothetical protein
MKLNAPKKMTWLLAVILGLLGLLSTFVAIPFVSLYAFWFVFAGFGVLTLGTFLKGL